MRLPGPAPRFSLAKSYPGFAPIGPELVTPEEFGDPDDLELGCSGRGSAVTAASAGPAGCGSRSTVGSLRSVPAWAFWFYPVAAHFVIAAGHTLRKSYGPVDPASSHSTP
ncbi:hypothetical protein [Streptomyces sp. NPDC059455]|uniref:hypothetical protein n=1 Tax=Streptomyces sp. NPDC059455 TaxID=3346837 RepID=UPI0036AB731A